MAPGPEMRASDGDRDKIAGVLREHYAQGRLNSEEFDERLEQLYSSKTYGELARLTSDLPDVDLRRLPETSPEPSDWRMKGRRTQRRGVAAMWATWATASGVNWAIWLILGVTDGFDFPYPWPLWVMGPWGVVLLLTTFVTGVSDKSNR
ncbi:DUF1707 SHOCT-like domain-containing protein [Streptosporangium carneum]|uniref:DUF1707 domain-containing protein n=1 Tax=Streptosporangium carneum TaxID=47481 RepID=A0A9W6I500_9ACTN|nr:DUF1707 domain-containing protein [Streptosporangium carneum]GLK11797.1 hypothetical protein GCM10017600_52050 [Streptosporangium carneum]